MMVLLQLREVGKWGSAIVVLLHEVIVVESAPCCSDIGVGLRNLPVQLMAAVWKLASVNEVLAGVRLESVCSAKGNLGGLATYGNVRS